MATKHPPGFETDIPGPDVPDTSIWVDHGVSPPQSVPMDPADAAAYLANALAHPVYERWNWQRLIQVYGALPDARRAKPRVCKLLLDTQAVVEYWQKGKLQVVIAADAPGPDTVVRALLKTQKVRFRLVTQETAIQVLEVANQPMAFADELRIWLQRTGRLYNPQEHTNTLGAKDDHAALAAFLRERTQRSRHTWRAYSNELQRLIAWCQSRNLGPLSDLTRQDLLQYKTQLQKTQPPVAAVATPAATSPLSERSRARAVAVVASLYRYWHSTGYLQGNPAAGLTTGSRAQSGFTPTRMVGSELLSHCDAWVQRSLGSNHINDWRRAAVWILFRYSGARIAELAWKPSHSLPQITQEADGALTLSVIGKGDKIRHIPLPTLCVPVLRGYRLARGLHERPDVYANIPIIHGEKSGYLGVRGLYDEVKAVLMAMASELQPSDPQSALLLRTVSPHWLRHAYARTLVVDKRIPLPAAQALLGHASVQTTASYAKTDLAQLRVLVEKGFSEEVHPSVLPFSL